ncbi:hypothetical protein PIB30_035813 [Stylosanthes scabra]|uniref:Transposase, Ptta/En/Spm, plant n=1 Tax=Stylosanthes scabra TaxID=79078 RepID=A0ABU6XF25_9FABA|nr:hypothetical protein [Stylosanthes scabra]
MLQSLGKSWREARNRLFHEYYDPRKTLEQNVDARSRGIDENDWRRFLRYRLRPDTKEKCSEPIEAAIHTHTGGSKSLARRIDEESRQQGRDVSRGEVWMMTHKKVDGSYIHEDAQTICEKIMDIEQRDESSRLLFQNDSLAQVLGKEHPGRVRGMGFGAIPSRLFGRNSQQTGGGAQAQETQRVVEELRAELTTEKLKRQALESEVASEKIKRQAMKNTLRYLIQKQGVNLLADIIAGMNSFERQS